MATAPSLPASLWGLIDTAGQAPVPLERVEVAARVLGHAVRVTVTQRFRNMESSPLEVVYVFPLDEGAAVCGFEADVDGKRVVGSVKERDSAFAEYDDALEAGHGAFLLDEERPDVFTASLGNVRPGATVSVAVTYVSTLTAEGAAARFLLPTTVSPRYAPAEDRQGVGRTPAEALNPPTADAVPYRLSFDMQVEMGGAITSIESPSHPISVDREGCRAHVRLTQRDVAMDRDLVIVIASEDLERPHAVVERGPQGDHVMAVLRPQFEASAAAAEVVFLVDRSGSMAGSSIAEVRNALDLALRALTPGCRFDIVGFGSSFQSLFGESRGYDEDSLGAATDHVEAMDADLGGTEILPALEHVLARPRTEGLARQVIVLTDGEVTNTDAVIALAQRHAGTTRVFTFGIGAGASVHLVKAMARVTGGACELIAPGERIEAKVLRQFKRVLSPAVTDVRVTWPGGVVGTPERPPAVFAGERLLVFALPAAASGTIGEGVVRLSGRRAGVPFEIEIAVDAAEAVAGDTIGTLAARSRIRDLEESADYLGAKRSQQGRVRAQRTVTDEIVRLGVTYSLVSRETSFVAVEQRETPVTEPTQLRRVPVALTSGWGGGHRGIRPVPRMLSAPAKQGLLKRLSPRAGRAFSASVGDAVAMCLPDLSAASMESFMAPAPSRQSSPSARPAHVELVRLQKANGSWELTRELADVTGGELTTWRERARELGGTTAAGTALATAIALAWLARHAAEHEVEWQMAADKGRAWLLACGIGAPAGTSWEALGAALAG